MVAAMDCWKGKASLALSLICSLTAVASSMAMEPVQPMVCRSKHIPHLKINTALLTIHNDPSLLRHIYLYIQSQECVGCTLPPVAKVDDNCTLRVDSRWPTRVEVRIFDDGKVTPLSSTCSEDELTQTFQEGGHYSLYVRSNDMQQTNVSCDVIYMTVADPNIPIYVAIGLFFSIVVICKLLNYAYRKGYIHRLFCFWSTESMMSDLGRPNNINNLDDGTISAEQTAPPAKERLKSLDAMRGLSIVIMIFVNYGGGQYWFFKHSKWNGLTVADLVFPWFVFIMGTAMVYSIRSQVLRNVPKWRIMTRILRRSATLFFLGLIINSKSGQDGVDLETFRIPGVLQRFAGTYLITATIYLYMSIHCHNGNQHSRFASIKDISDSVFEWVAHLCLVTLQLTITFCMPVPGCPTGYLGPGGFGDGGKYFNCTGGAAGYIDRQFFGDAHIYQHPTSTEIYHQTVPYDPEGLLGTLSSCFICFLGLQAGKIIVTHRDWVKRCKRFFIWGVVLGAIGALLCKASQNDGWIPVNKNLWSLSFVLVLSSMGFFLLMFLYITIDVYRLWSGAPLFHAGMNAIALYCGHEGFSGRFPVGFAVPKTHAAQLALNIWGATFWVLVAVYLHYKEIFISV